MANIHLDATEHGEQLVFLHAVQEGPASRSFGLQVARLAGVPREVIASAQRYLEALEHRGQAEAPPRPQAELALAPATRPDEALELLRAADPDRLTPREALQLVYELKSRLGG